MLLPELLLALCINELLILVCQCGDHDLLLQLVDHVRGRAVLHSALELQTGLQLSLEHEIELVLLYDQAKSQIEPNERGRTPKRSTQIYLALTATGPGVD